MYWNAVCGHPEAQPLSWLLQSTSCCSDRSMPETPAIRYLDSSAPMVEKAQQLPQVPWFLMAVVIPAATQSTEVGREAAAALSILRPAVEAGGVALLAAAAAAAAAPEGAGAARGSEDAGRLVALAREALVPSIRLANSAQLRSLYSLRPAHQVALAPCPRLKLTMRCMLDLNNWRRRSYCSGQGS